MSSSQTCIGEMRTNYQFQNSAGLFGSNPKLAAKFGTFGKNLKLPAMRRTPQEKPQIAGSLSEASLGSAGGMKSSDSVWPAYVAISADQLEYYGIGLGTSFIGLSHEITATSPTCFASSADESQSFLIGPDLKKLRYPGIPGDMLHLSKGDTVPADGLFVSGYSVLIDASSLIGESKPIAVTPENPVLVAGTRVLDGQCKMMVTGVGMTIKHESLMGYIQVLRNRLGQNTIDDKALVRFVAACGTMGSARNICSYKTGTPTTNKMTVVKSCICMNVKDVINLSDASSLLADLPEPLKVLLQSILDDTGGEVVGNKSGKNETLGTPTDTALLVFGLALGGNFQTEREAPTIVKVGPFNSTKKRLRVVLELLEQGGFRAGTQAASEIILANYDKVINSNSLLETVPLDEASVKHLQVTSSDFAGEGLGTLCLGYMELDKEFSAEDPFPTSGYTCIGIVGSTIPPGIKESVAICRSAGINGGATERTNWVFNEISSREMEDIDVFVAVLGSTVVFQIIIIEFLGN